MTTTSSATSATTPRSCVIMMIALPNSCCSRFISVEDLRLRRHVERRRRLVGDQQVGIVDQRHRDHHALAHAAGELVRVVVDPALGARDADRAAAARARARRACFFVTSRWSMIASTSCRPIVCTGFSDVIGSWKIIAMSLPRMLAQPARRCTVSRFLALEQRLAARRSCCASAFSPMIVRQVTLLPQPDSPTMPRVLPFSTEKLTPSTALTMPSSVRKRSAGRVLRGGPSAT